MTKIKDLPVWLFGCDNGLKRYSPVIPPVPVIETKKQIQEIEPVKLKIPKKPVKKQIVYSSEGESEEEIIVKKKKVSTKKKAKVIESTDKESLSENSSDEEQNFSEKKKKLKNLKKYLK